MVLGEQRLLVPSPRDVATYERPTEYPEGIDYVLVNGVVVVENGRHTGAKPGKVIYGPGRTQD